MTRIENHPVLGLDCAEAVDIVVDGRTVPARAGDTVAVALWANGQKALRRSKTGQPRGMYCGIGHCFECRLDIENTDGERSNVRSCLTPVTSGLRVLTISSHDENIRDEGSSDAV